MTKINVVLRAGAIVSGTSKAAGTSSLGAVEQSLMNPVAQKRNRLTPWYIGLVIILAAVIFVGYRMWAGNCPAPTIVELGVLTVIPGVYLVLMYLTLVSQE